MSPTHYRKPQKTAETKQAKRAQQVLERLGIPRRASAPGSSALAKSAVDTAVRKAERIVKDAAAGTPVQPDDTPTFFDSVT